MTRFFRRDHRRNLLDVLTKLSQSICSVSNILWVETIEKSSYLESSIAVSFEGGEFLLVDFDLDSLILPEPLDFV